MNGDLTNDQRRVLSIVRGTPNGHAYIPMDAVTHQTCRELVRLGYLARVPVAGAAHGYKVVRHAD